MIKKPFYLLITVWYLLAVTQLLAPVTRALLPIPTEAQAFICARVACCCATVGDCLAGCCCAPMLGTPEDDSKNPPPGFAWTSRTCGGEDPGSWNPPRVALHARSDPAAAVRWPDVVTTRLSFELSALVGRVGVPPEKVPISAF